MDQQAFDLMMSRFDNIDENLSDIKLSSGKHEKRIRSLEDTRTSQKGIMIGGGTAVTTLAGAVTWLINTLMRHN